MIEHSALMMALAQKHEIISKLIGSSRVSYLDVPVHGNVGDLLIMLGTFNFLRKNGHQIRFASAYHSYKESWLKKDDVILFQGGGNLGDLYAGPQQARERTVAAHKNNRVIILPQTIHFKNQSNYEKCCAIFSQHRDLHVFVRDDNSFALAKKMSPSVYLMPDMAHSLWPLSSSADKFSDDTLFFLRTDSEAALKANARKSTDWPEIVGKRRTSEILFMFRVMKLARLIGVGALTSYWQCRLWEKYAKRLVQESIDLFSSHRSVYTDRLHGHILSSLLSLQNTIVDNSYGKNHSYVNAWTEGSPLTIKELV